MPRCCVVPDCCTKYQEDQSKYSLFQVPKDELILQKWEAAIPGIQYLQPHHYVCEKHFLETEVRRKNMEKDSNDKIASKKVQLESDAIPSIFPGRQIEPPTLPESTNYSETPIVLPERWYISNAPNPTQKSLCVFHIQSTPETGIPRIDKVITIDESMSIKYYVYEKLIKPKSLPDVLTSHGVLGKIMGSFEIVRICAGMENNETKNEKCLSITKKAKYCKPCQRRNRVRNPTENHDRLKLNLLRKKLRKEQRQKRRTKLANEVLKKSLEERTN